MEKTTALVITGKEKIEFMELPKPEPGDYEVLFHSQAASICTIDKRAYKEIRKTEYPFLGGHDGKEEIMTIEPFHGNKARIHHDSNGELERVYSYPGEIEFAHALTAGKIGTKRVFILGVRKGKEELAVIKYTKGKYIVEMVDKKAGTANTQIIKAEKQSVIMAANHTSKQACLYFKKK